MALLHHIGEALAIGRLLNGLDQQQVALGAGITRSRLCHFERGRRRPSLDTLDQLVESAGMDPWLLAYALERAAGKPRPATVLEGVTRVFQIQRRDVVLPRAGEGPESLVLGALGELTGEPHWEGLE